MAGKENVLLQHIQDVRALGPFQEVSAAPLHEADQDKFVALLSLRLNLLGKDLAHVPVLLVNGNHVCIRREIL